MNLTQYRQGGSRFFSYRQIFRHNIRYSDADRTGGRRQYSLAGWARQLL